MLTRYLIKHSQYMIALFAVALVLQTEVSLAQNRSIHSGNLSLDRLSFDAKTDTDPVGDDYGIDEDIEFSEDPQPEFDKEQGGEAGTDTLLHRYWDKYRNDFNSIVTLDHEYAYQFGEPEQTVVNRSSLRLEIGRLFAERYYGKIDFKIKALYSDDHLAREKDETISTESNLRQADVEANFGNLTIKAGKQILIWGESDTAVITDLISPRDNTELYFKNLEDSRVSQLMLATILYNRYGSFQCFLTPDPAEDLFPEPGTEYYVDAPMPDVEEITEDKPGAGDTEYGFRWKKTFGQSDIALMGAELIENSPTIVFQDLYDSGKMRLKKNYQRFRMVGFAGNLSSGNFLWKAEAAYSWDRPLQCEDHQSRWATIDKDIIDIALAAEYSSTSRLWSLTMEIANKHILQFSDRLTNESQNEPASTLIVSRKFLNETLSVEYTILAQLNTRDTFQKLRAEYELTDNLTGILEMGGFTSQHDDGAFWNYRNKYRILAALRFQI